MIKKIFLIFDESYFFQPNLINNLINKIGKENFVGVIVINKLNKKNSINKYFLSNILNFKIIELIIYFLIFLKFFLLKLLNIFKKKSDYLTVESVVKAYGIPYLCANYSLKKKELYNFINKKNPSIILSSCSLYIPKEIYQKKNSFCINRHSGKLPNYAGLLPIFHYLSNNETFLHVSVHEVKKKIDTGKVIVVKKFKRDTQSLYNAYKASFYLSVDAILSAIEKLKNYKKIPKNHYFSDICYHQFPQKKEWSKFRKNGFKLIEWKDLVNEK
jgi:folate-dependent phosphoribosylglycinamide formyltransferase PurN